MSCVSDHMKYILLVLVSINYTKFHARLRRLATDYQFLQTAVTNLSLRQNLTDVTVC